MAITFAARVAAMRASEIRELLKLAGQRDVISFGGGLPPGECFPIEDLVSAATRVLRERGPQALQYSQTEGCASLRHAVAARAGRTLDVDLSPGDVIITAGSQQALDLTAKVFLDEGSTLFCESPTYLAAIAAFRTFRPRFVEIPSDDEGMVVPALERAIEGADRPRFVYVIPDFQNPSGRTWSLSRRRALLAVASRHQIPVVEDSPYSELRFEGGPLPSLKAMDRDGLVIYMSTFSKILSPGLRVAWMTAPPAVLEKYVLAKQGTDLNTSTLSQQILAAYLEAGGLDAHIDRVRAELRCRRDAMMEALQREMPGVEFTRPRGGMFLWVTLPADLGARDLLPLAIARGVAFPPGGSFFPNGGHENTFRLAYSDSPAARIAEGVRRLGRAYEDLSRARTSRPVEEPAAV